MTRVGVCRTCGADVALVLRCSDHGTAHGGRCSGSGSTVDVVSGERDLLAELRSAEVLIADMGNALARLERSP